MNFSLFKKAVSAQIDRMVDSGSILLEAQINPWELIDLYQGAFPEGTNPVFRERREHDCNCCNTFIRRAGRIIALVDGEVETIWSNINTGEAGYDTVAATLDAHLKACGIANVLRLEEAEVGTDFNFDNETDQKWEHFHHVLPEAYVVKGTNHPLNLVLNHYIALTNSLAVDVYALDTVTDLAVNGSIYRGEEKVSLLNTWKTLLTENHSDVVSEFARWTLALKMKEAANFRGSAIGQLVDNLTKGDELDAAVAKYEKMVAPENYKRSSKVVTTGMINEARKAVAALGMEDSLPRRHAVLDDLSIEDVLFANRTSAAVQDAFSLLEKSVAARKPAKLNQNPIAIGIEDFINDVVPTARDLSIYLEPEQENNLFTLVAPVHADAPSMLKWDNNFSWSYNNDLTDSSIAQRVSKAGGAVDGDVRVSLAWHNADDLDLHVSFDRGEHIYFSNKIGRSTKGRLDVDMNYGGNYNSVDPVENITWGNIDRLKGQSFSIMVKNMSRGRPDSDFAIEIACGDQLFYIEHPASLREKVVVATCAVDMNGVMTVQAKNGLALSVRQTSLWGLQTGQFAKVNLAMMSPNFWNGKAVGNKHYMFALEECVNPEPVRGFYNEFLRDELHKNRKVFEVLGNQMKAPFRESQISGLGFSSTQRKTVVFSVTGENSTKQYKVSI